MKGLVLDGGGVFGIGQAHVLAEIDTTQFDFFAGTSIGSVLAIAMGLGNTDPLSFPDFFHERMPRIFAGHWWRTYKPITPRYPDKELNRALQDFLGGSFGQCHKPVYVAAANLGAQKLKVFNSTHESDATMDAWEVGRCGVAAETYFEPRLGYGDGGIFANDPSMVAVSSSIQAAGRIEDLEICSIGTGSSMGSNGEWPGNRSSILRWGLWLMGSMMDGAANTMHGYFARSLPLKKYRRYDFVRDPSWKMDSASDMLKAEERWMSSCKGYAKQIQEEFCS